MARLGTALLVLPGILLAPKVGWACSSGMCGVEVPAARFDVPSNAAIPLPRSVSSSVSEPTSYTSGTSWSLARSDGTPVATTFRASSSPDEVYDELVPTAALEPGVYVVRGQFNTCGREDKPEFSVQATSAVTVHTLGTLGTVDLRVGMVAPCGGDAVKNLIGTIHVASSSEVLAASAVARLETTLDCAPLAVGRYGEVDQGVPFSIPCTSLPKRHTFVVTAHVTGAAADPPPLAFALDLTCDDLVAKPEVVTSTCTPARPLVEASPTPTASPNPSADGGAVTPTPTRANDEGCAVSGVGGSSSAAATFAAAFLSLLFVVVAGRRRASRRA